MWFNIGTFNQGTEFEYKVKRQGNGLFAMVVEGEFTIEGQDLHHRDAVGISEKDSIKIVADTDNARILLIDVPMKLILKLNLRI